jgi:hypothetical protein
VRLFFSQVAADVMDATCVVKDANSLVETLYTDDAVQQRIAMIAVAPKTATTV